MTRQATEAVVSLAALDLRRDPEHSSELLSQLLLGERVRLIARAGRGGWLRVRSSQDAYSGWVREWGIRRLSGSEARRWELGASGRLRALLAPALSRPGSGDLVRPLFWGARVRLGPRRGPWRRVGLPDGRQAWVRAAQVRGARERPPSLRSRIRSLIGIPYLWGGRTPAGLDCSGFTQLVFLEQGVSLPRDAKDQFDATLPLSSDESTRLGDLVFFARPGERPSHVGIYLDKGTFVHCRGDVHLGSLDGGNPLSEKELIPQFVGFRRVGRESSKGDRKGSPRGESA